MPAETFTVRIASPCGISWDSMHGDDKKRFCHECNLFVFNLPAMDEDERIDFMKMAQMKGKACARIYTRKDSTVMLRDCPLGEKLRRVYTTTKIACGIILVGLLTKGTVFGVEHVRAEVKKAVAQLNAQMAMGMGNIYVPPPSGNAVAR